MKVSSNTMLTRYLYLSLFFIFLFSFSLVSSLPDDANSSINFIEDTGSTTINNITNTNVTNVYGSNLSGSGTAGNLAYWVNGSYIAPTGMFYHYGSNSVFLNGSGLYTNNLFSDGWQIYTDGIYSYDGDTGDLALYISASNGNINVLEYSSSLNPNSFSIGSPAVNDLIFNSYGKSYFYNNLTANKTLFTNDLRYLNGTSYSFGGGSPAGSDNQIQYNDNGSFGASANFTWDGDIVDIMHSGGSGLRITALDGTQASYLEFASNTNAYLGVQGATGEEIFGEGSGGIPYALAFGSSDNAIQFFAGVNETSGFGLARLTINATNGYAGFGTNNPQSPIHIYGANGVGMGLIIESGNANDANFNWLTDAQDWNSYVSGTTGELGFTNEYGNVMSLNPNSAFSRVSIFNNGDSPSGLVINNDGAGGGAQIDFSSSTNAAIGTFADDATSSGFTGAINDALFFITTDNQAIQFGVVDTIVTSIEGNNTRFKTNLIPMDNDAFSLGNSTNIWNNLFVNNINASGNVSFKTPHGLYTSNVTQTLSGTSTPTAITFNNVEDSYYITKTGNTNFSVVRSGGYNIELKATAEATAPNKHIEVWIQKNGINVARSNRITELPLSGENTIPKTFHLDLNTTDNFRVMWASPDDVGATLFYTTNTSYSPESPSATMSITRIGDIT